MLLWACPMVCEAFKGLAYLPCYSNNFYFVLLKFVIIAAFICSEKFHRLLCHYKIFCKNLPSSMPKRSSVAGK